MGPTRGEVLSVPCPQCGEPARGAVPGWWPPSPVTPHKAGRQGGGGAELDASRRAPLDRGTEGARTGPHGQEATVSQGPPMPLPRTTTRRWMVAVAIVGLLLVAIVGGRRQAATGLLTCNWRMMKLDRRITSAG